MERNTLDDLIKKAMSEEMMDIPAPDLRLVSAARNKIATRKIPVAPANGFYDWMVALVKDRLKFYQVGFSVLVTCLCLFYSIEISVDSRNSHGFSNYSVSSLSIKNSTISVNSSTILTSIPTLRN